MTEMNLEKLKKDALLEDVDISLESFDRLSKIKGKEVINFLIPLLKHENPRIRNSSALALATIGDAEAVGSIVKAIENPIDKNNIGSLVHALVSFDCSDLFLFLVKIALSNSYEAQNHSLTILEEQQFKVQENEIKHAKQMIESYKNSDEKCDNYEELIEELTQCINEIKGS